MQVRGSIAAPCFLLLTPEMLSLENFGRSCFVQACHFQTLVRHVLFCTLCSLRGSGLVRLAFLLRRAAHCSALLLLNSPRPSAAMPTEEDMEVCWPGSSDDDDTAEVLCCPYKVLRIAKCSSVEEAQAAAERAIMTMSAGGGNEWIVNMKLAAFAAIVQTELGEDKAWKLYREVRQKNPGLKVVDLVRDAHDVGQRPPADGSPGQHKLGLPEQNEQGERAPRLLMMLAVPTGRSCQSTKRTRRTTRRRATGGRSGKDKRGREGGGGSTKTSTAAWRQLTDKASAKPQRNSTSGRTTTTSST